MPVEKSTVWREGYRPGEAGTRADPALPRLEYCDEALRDPSQAPPVDVHQPPAFLHKLLQLAGISLHFEELPSQVSRLPAPMLLTPLPASASIPLTVVLIFQAEPPNLPLQIGSCSGYMELIVKLKQNEAFPGPKVGPQAPGEERVCPISALSSAVQSFIGQGSRAGHQAGEIILVLAIRETEA